MENSTTIRQQKYSDIELLNLCKKYGKLALANRRQFAALLPEVLRRELYRKNFHSIYEFAARLAGISREQVNEGIRVDEKLQDKPVLRELVVTQGWSKMRTVCSIATQGNQVALAETVKSLPKSSLEQYVRDWKRERGVSTMSESVGQEKSLPGEAKFEKVVRMEGEVARDFVELKLKIEREEKRKLTDGEVMNVLLGRALGKEGSRNVAGGEDDRWACAESTNVGKDDECVRARVEPKKPVGRYILVAYRRQLSRVCSYPGCEKLATEIHHPERFSEARCHKNLKPLCREHHLVAHAGLIAEECGPVNEWRVREVAVRSRADQQFQRRLWG